MNQTYAGPTHAVFDDVLDEDAWSQVWTYFQFEHLDPVTQTEGAWKISDGRVLASPDFHAPRSSEYSAPTPFPTQTPIDFVVEHLLDHTDELGEWVGADWQYLAGRGYIYGAGTSLSWHRDDHQYYAGAFVYYAHPVWDVQWGGELLIADVEEPTELPVMPFRFDHREYSDTLLESGRGHFVSPRPNRLVILGAQPHRVSPVTAAAGDHVRASLAGFFVRETPPED